MRWQLVDHGWSVGQWYVPVGTIIDDRMQWLGSIPLPPPLPLNAYSLDAEALAMMKQWYPDQWHLLRYDTTSIKP
jgi:hypothetical protein